MKTINIQNLRNKKVQVFNHVIYINICRFLFDNIVLFTKKVSPSEENTNFILK